MFSIGATCTARAWAADPADLPPAVSAPDTSGIDHVEPVSIWSRGESRAFVSSVVELGFVYMRPQLAAGFGKPHWSWIGLEVQPSFSTGGTGVYGGARAALPFVDLRAGARYVFAAGRKFLVPRESYARDDVERLDPRAQTSHYVALESELSGTAPAPGGSLFAVGSASLLFGVPEGWFVFDESLHVVVDPPMVWRARLGYALALGEDDFLSVGPVGEVIGVPDREAFVVRTGPAVSVKLTAQLDMLASIAFVVASPDTTGLLGADIGRIGLRWRWATGAGEPPLPW
jgi:hypothetical protein